MTRNSGAFRPEALSRGLGKNCHHVTRVLRGVDTVRIVLLYLQGGQRFIDHLGIYVNILTKIFAKILTSWSRIRWPSNVSSSIPWRRKVRWSASQILFPPRDTSQLAQSPQSEWTKGFKKRAPVFRSCHKDLSYIHNLHHPEFDIFKKLLTFPGRILNELCALKC